MLQPNQKNCGGCTQTFHFKVVKLKHQLSLMNAVNIKLHSIYQKKQEYASCEVILGFCS